MDRSYLFAPGHNVKLLSRVFAAGADAVMLDLEDAVPEHSKETGRRMVAEALADHPAWVRVNAVGTPWCAADLNAVAERAHGIRIPKVESADDVRWVAERTPGRPLICAIETARGVLAAQQIAAVPGVSQLAMGGVDLARDLNATSGALQTLHVRSHLVLVSRAAGIEPPIDSVYPLLDDEDGLREQAQFARSLGFFGKSAVHPRQLSVLHEVFTPTDREIAWARDVIAAFDAVAGNAARLPSGEFVDLPVAERARRLLEIAAACSATHRSGESSML
jgi:citrate lyase subunit beta/citryl-CoA lyase